LIAWGISPNAISIAGMISGIGAGAAFGMTAMGWGHIGIHFAAATLLMQLRLLANMLDGMVAVGTGQASPAGELYNEVPDRISDAAMLIGAGYAVGSAPALGYIAACLALFVAYLRAQGALVSGRQEFCGPMAKQQRVFVMTIAALYSGFAPAEWQIDMPFYGSRQTMSVALVIVIAGIILTVFRRLNRIVAVLSEREDTGS
jgi:phosphatidylglycerophosphate synthase